MRLFQIFTLKPATIADIYSEGFGNKDVLKNLDHQLSQHLQPQLDEWNQQAGEGRTLIVQPHIKAVIFIGTTQRILIGGGRSQFYVTVNFTDAQSGDTIALPEFYQFSNPTPYTYSANDYAMIRRLGNDIHNYVGNNYPSAIGGGTAPSDRDKSKFKKLRKQQPNAKE